MKHFFFQTLLALFCLSLLAGCGQATYETRLAETDKYYSYVHDMESSLGKKWKSKRDVTGIEITPPRGFKKISAPKQEVDEEGNILSEEEDRRQPHNIVGSYDGELPGLIGAWKKKVDVDVGDTSQEFVMYMYVLARESSGGTNDDATTFGDEVYGQLAVDLNIDGQEAGENEWVEESYPSRDKYTKKVNYETMILTPGISIGGLAAKSVEFQLFYHTDKGKEVVILFVVPAGGLSRSDTKSLKSGINYCLQSLKIRKNKTSVPGGGANPKKSRKSPSGPAF